MKKVSIIIPCYNEEESLPLYFKAVDPVIKEINNYSFEFVLVNDGSKDHTLNVMHQLYQERKDVTLVSLSRNYGQNPAFAAGLKNCHGDYAIMMDADLQDPVTMIPNILAKFEEGYEVVNPHRVNRMKDSWFKRKTAGLFYKIINRLEGRKVIPENVNCFRGISRKVIDHINDLTEKDRYLLAEIPLIGFKTIEIDFAREERTVGVSKYNLKKMTAYALDNMSNETAKPLYLPIKLGGGSTCLWLIVTIVMAIFFGLSIGYPLQFRYDVFMPLFIVSCVFLSCSLLIGIVGILGVYLHNILINTRNRPTYVVDELSIAREEEK